jgi:tripartite-type tricarboxylate transporter receptor subunit TctC
MPDVPTIIEAGQSKFPIVPWFALVGPADLPAEVVATMNKAMAAALAKPSVREQVERHGFLPKSSTPAELAVYMKEQLAVWKAALKDSGIEPQ